MSVTLRKIKEEDLEMIMNWRMKPEVTKYMYTDPVLTLEKQKKWFEKIQRSQEDLYWIIEIDEGPVGLISLNNIDYQNYQCSWAYYIGEDKARGKGLGTILECNIYNYVFDHLKLNKLWCEVFTFNEKVIAIHQKFGSEIEGEFKDHIFKNGVFYNVVRMAITKTKWDRIKSQYTYDKAIIE